MPQSKYRPLSRTGITSICYIARLAKQVYTREDTESADHALKAKAAAHEQDVEELPQAAVDLFEHINADLTASDGVVQEAVVVEPYGASATCAYHPDCLNWGGSHTFLSTIKS